MDVKKIAALANIKLSQQELDELGVDLEKILAAFDKIKKVDTEDVDPLLSPLEQGPHWRHDEVDLNQPIDELLDQAPEISGRLYRVPRVIS